MLELLVRVRESARIAALVAVGIDHQLRPEAGSELDIAEQLAARHGVPFERLPVDVEPRDNLLAAARRARYAALEAAADRLQADKIAVAHTATDQVESVLLNITRGAGARGAGGIRARRGRIIRPLLGMSRQSLLDFLDSEGIAYALDPSNLDPRRARAELRAHVLPALRRINPRFEEAVGRFAARARQDDAELNRHVVAELNRRLGPLGSLGLTELTRLPNPIRSRVVRTWLSRHGLGSGRATVERLLLQIRTGKVADSVGGATLRSDGGRLWVMPDRPYSLQLSIPGEVEIEALNITIASSIGDARIVNLGDLEPEWEVAFDADRLHLGIEVRSWKEGDRLRPFGLDGHMKVGDVFTNEKIPHALRAVWPVAALGDDLLWVVGLRRSSLAPITGKTRHVLRMSARRRAPLQRVLGYQLG